MTTTTITDNKNDSNDNDNNDDGNEYIVLAEQIKEKANEEFLKKNYKEAIELYSEAIRINPDNCIYFSNRSCCYLHVDFVSKGMLHSCLFVACSLQ